MSDLAILAEATTLEQAGGHWSARHVAAVLDCARSTVYNTPWLLQCARRVGKSRLRWVPSDVRAGQLARPVSYQRVPPSQRSRRVS